MKDGQAADVALAVMQLAVVVRDEGPDSVRASAQDVLAKAGGDVAAALTVAAALIRVDAPIDVWWTPAARRAGRPLQPHGTHAAFVRHKKLKQDPCEKCQAGEREYQKARKRVQRSAVAA